MKSVRNLYVEEQERLARRTAHAKAWAHARAQFIDGFCSGAGWSTAVAIAIALAAWWKP